MKNETEFFQKSVPFCKNYQKTRRKKQKNIYHFVAYETLILNTHIFLVCD